MKGWLKGGLIGLIIGIFFGWFAQIIVIKSIFLHCTESYLRTIWSNCNILSSILLTPKYAIIKLFRLYGMGEMLILIYLPLIGLILGSFIGYLIKKKKISI